MKLDHVTAAMTTFGQLIKPRDVITPVTRSFSIFNDSTFVRVSIDTPSFATLFANALRSLRFST